MAGFIERFPDVISPNPGGADDPLGESVLDPSLPPLRVFEPRDVRLVIGRSQNPHRECLVDHCAVDGVSIHRRATGGGAVVLAPGMVVMAIRMPRDEVGTDCYFDRVNQHIIPTIGRHSGQNPVCRGHGDLAMERNNTGPAKILGTSLRQFQQWAVYLGVLMIDDAVPLMQRYLAPPSRQPDYRGDRSHAEFCTHLGAYDVMLPSLISDLHTACLPLTATSD